MLFRVKVFSGKIRLRTIPAIEATASAVRVILWLPTVNVMPSVRPSATTRITAAIIVFLAFENQPLLQQHFLHR